MRQKSRIKAILLALFAGFVGAHKFYLGRAGGFIGFMVLFIVSINVFRSPILSFIAGIVDAIKLINMTDEAFDEKYNGANKWERGSYRPRSSPTGPAYNTRGQRPGQDRQVPVRSPQQNTKANALRVSGMKKYKDFDLEDAIRDFSEALRLVPNDPALHFNLACAYSLTEKKELAYFHLSRAIASGFKDAQRILSHDDLAFVRIQPEFEAFRSSGFLQVPYDLSKIQTRSDASEGSPKANIGDKNQNRVEDALLTQLQKLAELRQKGVLSEEEFQFETKKILRQ